MSSLEGDNLNHGCSRDTASDISIGDRIEHDFNYDQAKAASYLVSPNIHPDSASTALEPNLLRPSTSYILIDNLETNVDNWITNCDNERNRRRDNMSGAQQSSLNAVRGTLASIWYMLAMLPAISVQRHGWCSPSNSYAAVLNFVDITSTYVKQIVSNTRTRLSQLAIDQILRECFVIVLDFALALHAFIFLILAVYQE